MTEQDVMGRLTNSHTYHFIREIRKDNVMVAECGKSSDHYRTYEISRVPLANRCEKCLAYTGAVLIKK